MSRALALDSEQMFAAAAALPEQLLEAIDAAHEVALPELATPSAVVVAGMGGSSVAGEILRAIGAPTMSVPVVLGDGYELPGFVGPTTLVIAISFSGETEETLGVARQAIARGSPLVVITSGGALGELAEECATAQFLVRGDIPEPRAALGAMVAPLLVCLERLGLLEEATVDLRRAGDQLARRRDGLVANGGGVAASIAARIGRSFPLVYAASGIGAVAARRWKTQVNENAKSPAFFSVQPELSHNEIAGFGVSGDVTRQVLTLVNLRSDYEHPRVAPRVEFVTEALREVVSDVIDVHAEGESALAQLFDLILTGDFVSLHLAGDYGVDPGPVPILLEVKEALAVLD